MDKAMDTPRKKHLEMKEPPSLKNIVAIFRKTSAGSKYRRYALQSIFCVFTHDASIKNKSIHDPIRDVLQTKSDLSNDFVELLRSQYTNGIWFEMIADPRVDDHCIYHCHKEDEECQQGLKD